VFPSTLQLDHDPLPLESLSLYLNEAVSELPPPEMLWIEFPSTHVPVQFAGCPPPSGRPYWRERRLRPYWTYWGLTAVPHPRSVTMGGGPSSDVRHQLASARDVLVDRFAEPRYANA
jgi:hypothetical protein